jgi:hypothetical protein
MYNHAISCLKVFLLLISIRMYALDIKLINKTKKPVLMKIDTQAKKRRDLLTLTAEPIKGIVNSPDPENIPVWRGTTVKIIGSNQAILIKKIHPVAETITIDDQELLLNPKKFNERLSKTYTIAIVPGKLWGITFRQLAPTNQDQKHTNTQTIEPRTTEFLQVDPKNAK